MKSLRSNRGWSNAPSEERTCDLLRASGVRETRDAAGRISYDRKERHASHLAACGTSGYEVRFAVASETQVSGVGDDSEVALWRLKRRTRFVHKGMFAFDLTRVKQGATQQLATDAEWQYEIEIEFCGQRRRG